MSPASTASLIVVALAASVGAGSQARHGQLCWRVAVTFSAPAAAGAYLGTLANGLVSGRTLILAFIPVMLIAAILTYRRGDDAGDDDASGGCPTPGLVPSAGAGLAVGAMTGFFGVGGGFLIVPALTALLALPVRRAVATSLAIITLTGIAALVSHLVEGADPNWSLTLTLSASAALGALGGSALGRRLSAETLAHAFGAVVALVALFLLVDIVFLDGPPAG